jgi:hypothetical protein
MRRELGAYAGSTGWLLNKVFNKLCVGGAILAKRILFSLSKFLKPIFTRKFKYRVHVEFLGNEALRRI